MIAKGIFLTPEGDYKINLLNKSADMFPDNLIKQIPEIKQDVLEFGKAFACEMTTSCGMILCRIFEVLLKEFGIYLKISPRYTKNQKLKRIKKVQ